MLTPLTQEESRALLVESRVGRIGCVYEGGPYVRLAQPTNLHDLESAKHYCDYFSQLCNIGQPCRGLELYHIWRYCWAEHEGA